MNEDLTRAEQAAFARLDAMTPCWRDEPGALHEPEIRAVVDAVEPVIAAATLRYFATRLNARHEHAAAALARELADQIEPSILAAEVGSLLDNLLTRMRRDGLTGGTDQDNHTTVTTAPGMAEHALDSGIAATTTVQRAIPDLAAGDADLTTVADLDHGIADALRILRAARRAVRELDDQEARRG